MIFGKTIYHDTLHTKYGKQCIYCAIYESYGNTTDKGIGRSAVKNHSTPK